jgi:hypothetical protein
VILKTEIKGVFWCSCYHSNQIQYMRSFIITQQKLFSSINFSIIFKIKSANFPIVNYFRPYTVMVLEYLLYNSSTILLLYTWWLNELGRWIYKLITNTAWVRIVLELYNKCIVLELYNKWFDLIDLIFLMPLSTIFQLCHGNQF